MRGYDREELLELCGNWLVYLVIPGAIAVALWRIGNILAEISRKLGG